MGYWGWRPLLLMICISVWVTGCNISSEYAATIPPTELPPITLTVRLREPTVPHSTPFTPLAIIASPAVTQIASADIEAYTVRPGDTLLGIALDFNIDVNLLSDYNPGVNPRSLQVGQQILVPVGVTPAPTSKALVPLVVDSPNCSATLMNSLLCLGRIYNTQAYPVGDIRIRVQLVDANQQVLEEKHTSIDRMLLLPGEATPFSVLFNNENQTPHSYVTAILESALANPSIQNQFLTLQVEAESGQFGNGYFELSAVLVNPTEQTSAPVGLSLTLLDANQQVIGYRFVKTAEGLAPGGRLPVVIQAMSQSGAAPASYSFTYEALPAVIP